MKKTLLVAALGAVLGFSATTASASGGAGSWDLKFGLGYVNPKSDNGTLAGTLRAEVNSDVKPTIGFGYWFSDNVQLDVLGAIPFSHDVRLNGVEAASLKHLPPTVSLQYHFAPGGSFCPFVGVGVNYTYIYDEETRGPLAGTRLKLDNSFGLAAQVGAEFKVNDRWAVAADVRWIDIDSDASVNGADVGTVNVDPIVVGAYLVYSF
jgi:outer membrane protein